MRMAVQPRHQTSAPEVITFFDTINSYLGFQNHYLQHRKHRKHRNKRIFRQCCQYRQNHRYVIFQEPIKVPLLICQWTYH